jgi:hypothetical protein
MGMQCARLDDAIENHTSIIEQIRGFFAIDDIIENTGIRTLHFP